MTRVAASAGAVHAGQLAPMLSSWFGDQPEPRAMAVRYYGEWVGPDELSVGDRAVAIRECPSDLAAREALIEADPAKHLVLLVEFDELSSDLAADLRSPTVRRLNAWESVLAKFGVKSVDARLTRETWLAEALLEAGGSTTSFRRGVSRQLDSERAWQTFFQHRLRLEASDGLVGLLRWTLSPDAAAFAERSDAERSGTQRELVRRIPGAAPVIELAALGKAGSAAALGLAARAAVGGDASETRGGARALLAAHFEAWSFSEEEAELWATASESLARELLAQDPVAAARLLAQGDREASLLNADALIETSPVLRSGLRARVTTLAASITEWRAGAGSAARVSAAAELVGEHALPDEAPTATMAARLVRWLDDAPARATTLLDAARIYAQDGSYADLTRFSLRQRTGTSLLDGEIHELLELADARRRGQDEQFAKLLAQEQAQPASNNSLLAVEDLLDCVVGPLARQHPVLLVVLDGLSHRVVSELGPSLASRGWSELRRDAHAGRALVLSALPSVTEFSRASLLAGSLVRGKAGDEAKRFAEHPALRSADPKGAAPVLFHKATLADARGLAAEVSSEVAGDRQVVGVVINAIDDHLDRNEQVAIDWSLDTLIPLGALLDTARDAGRLVVIASDHGHVLERRASGPSPAPGESGQRWRDAGESLIDGEIEISGPRVMRADRRCVLAWDETIRYSARKHGYHGGANPQEVLAPLLVLSPGGEPVDGWAEASDLPPAWWTPAPAPVVLPAAPPLPVAARTEMSPPRPAASDDAQLSLADDVAVAAYDWVVELLASEVYGQQRQLAGRAVLDDDRVSLLLRTLEANGGMLLSQALAQATGWSTARLPGMLASASRILNVEGYPVLSIDQAAGTVTLDLPTLRRQFGLAGD